MYFNLVLMYVLSKISGFMIDHNIDDQKLDVNVCISTVTSLKTFFSDKLLLVSPII